jgi:hypothetical protein
MKVVSICVKCEHQNKHEVDHNGQATVTCQTCQTIYDVRSYQVRAKGGQRDRRTGIKQYRIRVKEPDRDETLLEFPSNEEIEMRSGDWIVGSYDKVYNPGKLIHLSNSTINRDWQIGHYGPTAKTGCLTLVLGLAALVISVITLIVYFII